jgi:cytochrome P450
MLMPAFTPRRVAGYATLMTQAAQRVLDNQLPARQMQATVAMDDLWSETTMDAILQVLFSHPAEGDAQRALHWLAPLQGASMYCEALAQSCTLRLAAQRQLGEVQPEALALADAALAGGTLPALLALELRRERRLAALAAGDDTTAEALQRAMADSLQRLEHSLDSQPGLQATFAARWAEHRR